MRVRLLFLAALWGCAFDDHRAGELCSEVEPCADDQVCTRGLCRPAGSPVDAVVGQPPFDASVRNDSAFVVDAAVVERDATPDMAQDLGLEPDLARPPPPPEDAAPPPPPDVEAPPTIPPPPVGPMQGLPGCDPQLWCTWAEADAVVSRVLPQTNFGGELVPLTVARNRELHAVTLIRFPLRALVGRRVAQVQLILDVGVSSPGGREEDQESDLEVETVVGPWNEGTVTWEHQPFTIDNRMDVAIPAGLMGAQTWDITALFPGMVLPDSVSLRIEEEGNGSYLFVNREAGADGDPGWPPRLQIRLAE